MARHVEIEATPDPKTSTLPVVLVRHFIEPFERRDGVRHVWTGRERGRLHWKLRRDHQMYLLDGNGTS